MSGYIVEEKVPDWVKNLLKITIVIFLPITIITFLLKSMYFVLFIFFLLIAILLYFYLNEKNLVKVEIFDSEVIVLKGHQKLKTFTKDEIASIESGGGGGDLRQLIFKLKNNESFSVSHKWLNVQQVADIKRNLAFTIGSAKSKSG